MAPLRTGVALVCAIVLAASFSGVHAKKKHPDSPYGRHGHQGENTPFSQFPLFDYVNTPDSNYHWVDTGVRIGNSSIGWTGYLINMTSQGWLTANDTNRPIWSHQLVILVPNEIKYPNVSCLYITGGSDNDSPPGVDSEDVLVAAVIAVEAGTIGATLFQVPNQPVQFAADPNHSNRGEDAFVAFTWAQYMADPSQPNIIAYFPMVKAAVRAMDTIQAFSTKMGLGTIEKFAVAGASKRGWTTWLTGASDTRVIGIMPIVMDMLNFLPNVVHMYQAYGGWTFAFKDYYDMNITQDFGQPQLNLLANIIDPLVYKDYLLMPKLVIDSTGDEFFMPDDDWFWWGKLSGETYRLMVQNAEHSMVTGIIEVLRGANGFYKSLIINSKRPIVDWTFDNSTGLITATTDTKPSKVFLRFATTFGDTRRDFRLVKGDTPADPCEFIKVKIFGTACINPVIWFGETIAPSSTAGGTYTYIATQPLPDKGWRGFFLEFEFDGPLNSVYRFTTQVAIIPNTFPFPDCRTLPEGCKGVLV